MMRIIRVRRSGVAYIGISIFLGVVAVNSTNNLLYLATAVLLGYMLASGLAGRSNIRHAEVSLAFAGEIYALMPCPVVVHVANKKRGSPLFLIEVGLAGAPDASRALFPAIQPGVVETRTLFATFPRRGRNAVPDVELSSVYPFNFFVRYWPVDPVHSGVAEKVVVFPFPQPCDPETVFLREEREREREAAGSLAETDIVGVRPYIEGDSMKRIHWKSSARTGKLKTRLYDGTSGGGGRIVDLDRLLAPDGPAGGDVERALSMACYAITEAVKAGIPVGMRARNEIVLPAAGRAHARDLLTRLALHE